MLSTFPTLLPFLLFAFVASITPGPTNILVLSNSARYGFKAALPIIFGACASAALIVLLVGSGFGQALNANHGVQLAMRWVGVVWLTFLAWQMFGTPVEVSTSDTPADNHRRLGLWGAAGLQLINPKTWAMALAVASVFTVHSEDRIIHTLYLSIAFFLVAIPCLGCWAALGIGSSRVLRSALTIRRFNRCMALLLLGSAWLSVLA
jgi:threonine/homoserine/homoserine lactone efflux protein